MKSAKQKKRNRINQFKAITLTLFIHTAIIGGLMFASGELGDIFSSNSDNVENTDADILSKAVANTKPN
ncbi:MAG: hypothetical protein AAF502_18290 [Bacteroidota bacterium]